MATQKNFNHVYISSTSTDLQKHREAVFKAVRAIGIFEEDILTWAEDGQSPPVPLARRLKQVTRSDLFILVIAHRYGRIPRGRKHSLPHLEYFAAIDAGIPVFAFFVDESIPWPPRDVEWDQQERLQEFKQQVREKVPTQIFQSAHELATMITQSVVLFLTRQKKKPRKQKRFNIKPIQVAHGLQLKTNPDIVLQVGNAEDGLPLLFEIRRSETMDLKAQLTKLAEKSSFILNHNAFKELLHAIDKHAVDVLTQNRLYKVRMQNGSHEELYVSSHNLTRLFHSTFSHIIDRAEGHTKPVELKKGENKTVRSLEHESEYHLFAHSLTTSSPLPFEQPGKGIRTLQSVGGRNRFMGISLTTGQTYSVGHLEGEWVEWRPFLYESIPATFPDCRCHIKTRRYTLIECHIQEYHRHIMEHALGHTTANAALDLETSFKISRQSVGKLLLTISRELAHLHENKRVHGDVKPANIVLTPDLPIIIDEFELNDGDFAPGWTPVWSAPEQVLKEPVTAKSDIYPLGRILTALVEGRIVGEMRRFKIPPLPNGSDLMDIFYNPSVYIDPDFSIVSKEGTREWLEFIKSCMKFHIHERPSDLEFYDRLSYLLDTYPLLGEVELITPANLVAATLTDGKDTVARLISDSNTKHF